MLNFSKDPGACPRAVKFQDSSTKDTSIVSGELAISNSSIFIPTNSKEASRPEMLWMNVSFSQVINSIRFFFNQRTSVTPSTNTSTRSGSEQAVSWNVELVETHMIRVESKTWNDTELFIWNGSGVFGASLKKVTNCPSVTEQRNKKES